MTYSIVEVFKTLQGEGMHAGRSAVFVRFAACNMWSGEDKDRERDAKRNGAECPKWCDTDFIKRYTSDFYALELHLDQCGGADLVVFTGGEPLLQLDAELVHKCNAQGYLTCVETNGTVEAKPGVLEALGHICMSPKQKVEALPLVNQIIRADLRQTTTTELKVVVPAYDPAAYEEIRTMFDRAYVSPEAVTTSRGASFIQRTRERQAAEYCLVYPGWALSLQMHKHLGLA